MIGYERAMVEHFTRLHSPRPSIAEVRAREAEGRRAWDQDTEQIAATPPELLRDSYRLGRWMQWAGHVLPMRASWAAEDADLDEPSRATWARAHRLLEYAESVMGAAQHWRIRQAELAPRFILRDGKLEMPEPVPLPVAPPRPRTLERIADAVGILALTRQTPSSAVRLFAQRLAEVLTQHRHGVPRMLPALAGAAAPADERTFRLPASFTIETSGGTAGVFRRALAEAERTIIESLTGREDPR